MTLRFSDTLFKLNFDIEVLSDLSDDRELINLFYEFLHHLENFNHEKEVLEPLIVIGKRIKEKNIKKQPSPGSVQEKEYFFFLKLKDIFDKDFILKDFCLDQELSL